MLLLWWLSMVQVISLSSWRKKFFISLVLSFLLFVSVLAEFCLNCEKFSISPLQTCAFRCWFSNNSVQFFFARMLPKLICGTSWHFLLHSFIPMIYLLFFLLEALWCCSFHSSSCFVKIMFFSLLLHLTGVLCHLFKFFHLIKFFLSFQPECCLSPS